MEVVAEERKIYGGKRGRVVGMIGDLIREKREWRRDDKEEKTKYF